MLLLLLLLLLLLWCLLLNFGLPSCTEERKGLRHCLASWVPV
jgi:hypothetical protein